MTDAELVVKKTPHLLWIDGDVVAVRSQLHLKR